MQKHQIFNRFLSIVFMMTSAIAIGDEIDEGMQAFNDGDYATAYQILLPLAKHHGYPTAMNTIGFMYENGLGITAQGSEAEQWYKKASMTGYSDAMYNLGLLYVESDLVSQDLAKGINVVINNTELQESMANKGRKRVEETFDWSAIAKQIETLYKSLKH